MWGVRLVWKRGIRMQGFCLRGEERRNDFRVGRRRWHGRRRRRHLIDARAGRLRRRFWPFISSERRLVSIEDTDSAPGHHWAVDASRSHSSGTHSSHSVALGALNKPSRLFQQAKRICHSRCQIASTSRMSAASAWAAHPRTSCPVLWCSTSWTRLR